MINQWQNEEDTTDTHYVVTEDVELGDSSSVAIRANPMGPDARFVKLTISNPDIPSERQAEWLCHFEPNAKLELVNNVVTAVVDSVTMDIYSLTPQKKNIAVEKYVVPKGRGLKETMRMDVSPLMTGDSEVMMTLFHIRKNGVPQQMKWVSGNVANGNAHIAWYEGANKNTLDFNLQNRELSIVRK